MSCSLDAGDQCSNALLNWPGWLRSAASPAHLRKCTLLAAPSALAPTAHASLQTSHSCTTCQQQTSGNNAHLTTGALLPKGSRSSTFRSPKKSIHFWVLQMAVAAKIRHQKPPNKNHSDHIGYRHLTIRVSVRLEAILNNPKSQSRHHLKNCLSVHASKA